MEIHGSQYDFHRISDKISSFGVAAALLLSTLRRLLSILLLRHLECILFAGIDVAFRDAQPSLEAV